MNGITHTFEVHLSQECGHGQRPDGIWFRYEKRVVTAYVPVAIVAVMFHIVVWEGGVPVKRAGKIWPLTWFFGLADRCMGEN